MTKQEARTILGVTDDASAEEIKRAHRRLVLKHHPDRNPEDTEGSKKRFEQVQEAKDALLDKDGKKKEEGIDDLLHGDFSEFFEHIVRDIRGSSRQHARRGDDIHQTIEISLEEAVAGCKNRTTVTRLMKCDLCNGQGGSDLIDCAFCEGKGKTEKVQGFLRISHLCIACDGKGKRYKNPCKSCKGQGRAPKFQTVAYVLKAGTQDGLVLGGRGEGNVGQNGGSSGDFFLHIKVKPHPSFQRINDDLFVVLPLSLGVAVLGADVDVPTLLHGTVKMNVPAGTQHGTRFRIPGKGATEQGVQIVEASIVVPTSLTPKQKAAFKDFLEA